MRGRAWLSACTGFESEMYEIVMTRTHPNCRRQYASAVVDIHVNVQDAVWVPEASLQQGGYDVQMEGPNAAFL